MLKSPVLGTMLICSLIAQFVFFLGALVLSARRTIRPKRSHDGIVSGALVLYGLIVGQTFLFSVVIPASLLSLGADKEVVVHSLPEAIANTPAVLLGWLPALIFASIVRRGHDAGSRAEQTAHDPSDAEPVKLGAMPTLA
jgi:hypothetical protein